jgi:hypothetical protein
LISSTEKLALAGRLTNFEIYGDDPETLASFYREVLGWRIEKAEGVDYWRIAIDADAAPLTTGGVTRRPVFAQAGWMNFVEVDSLEATLAAAERLGGTVLKPKTAVPRRLACGRRRPGGERLSRLAGRPARVSPARAGLT